MVAPRARLADVALDVQGNVLAGASVRVCEFGTSTPLTDIMYASRASGPMLANPFSADAVGFFEAWLDGQPRFVTVTVTSGGRQTTRTMEFSPDPAYGGAFRGPGPWVDVTAYGVPNAQDPTETRDDTAALQAIIDSQGPTPLWVLFFPPGHYYFRNLRIPAGTTILGAGMDATFLYATVGATGVGISEKTQVAENNPGGCQFIHLKQFTIRGQSRWSSCIKLGFSNPTNNPGHPNLDGGAWSTFSGMVDVVAQNATAVATWINTNVLSAYNCWGESSPTGWQIEGSTFSGFQLNAEDNSQYGFHLKGSYHNLYGAQLEPLPSCVPIFLDGATFCSIDKAATITQSGGLAGDVILASPASNSFVIDHTLVATGPISGHYLNHQTVETLDYGPPNLGPRLIYNNGVSGSFTRNGSVVADRVQIGAGLNGMNLPGSGLYLGRADHPLRGNTLAVPYTGPGAAGGTVMLPSIALPKGGFIEIIDNFYGFSYRVRLDGTAPLVDTASPHAQWAIGAGAPVAGKIAVFNNGAALMIANNADANITGFILNWRSV